MTNSHGNPYRYSLPPSTGSGPAVSPSFAADTEPAASNKLLWLVVALGLASYCISCGGVLPASSQWGVRFSTLAALVSALSFVPRPRADISSIAALAVMGFLEALSQLITSSPRPGWATILVVVVALQAVAAVAALTLPLKGFGGDQEIAPDDPYTHSAPVPQRYYPSNSQRPQQHPAQAPATAQARAAATAEATQSVTQRDELYAEYLGAPQGPHRAAASPESGQRSRTAHAAGTFDMPASGPTERFRPRADPGVVPPSQPF